MAQSLAQVSTCLNRLFLRVLNFSKLKIYKFSVLSDVICEHLRQGCTGPDTLNPATNKEKAKTKERSLKHLKPPESQ